MKKAIVIDLDGTLVRTNTFSDYILYSCCEALCAMRLDIVFSLLYYICVRKLRFISHAVMKYHILRCTSLFMQRYDRIARFVEKEIRCANDEVVTHLIEYKSQGYLSVLATAAPALYACALAERYGFEACVATPAAEIPLSQWQENKQEEKLRRVSELLEKHNAILDVVITDHDDDLPLLSANKTGKNIIIPAVPARS